MPPFQRALEAIALHNYLFPETVMRIVGFTRDADGLFRTILTQPYIACERLATPAEIDALVAAKGFHSNPGLIICLTDYNWRICTRLMSL